MKTYRNMPALVAVGLLLAAAPAAAQDPQGAGDKTGGSSLPWYSPAKYNPVKLFKPGPKSANDQLSSDGSLEDRLTQQLRLSGILPADKQLQDACSAFRDLTGCVAVLRLTHDLKIEFTCLKWNFTGIKPSPVADSCAGPAGGKAMPLDRALDLLVEPGVDARTQAKDALKKAHDDIKDATS